MLNYLLPLCRGKGELRKCIRSISYNGSNIINNEDKTILRRFFYEIRIMNFVSFEFVLVLSIAFLQHSASENCNKDDVNKCLSTMQTLLDEQLSSMHKNDSDLNDYCGKVEEDGICLQDATAACRKEHPFIAASTASLFNYLHMICQPGTDEQWLFLQIRPCLEKHTLLLEKCGHDNDHKHIRDNDLKTACKEIKIGLCVADISRKVCDKDGETFAKSMEYGLKETYQDVCSGVYTRVFNIWLIVCTVLIGYFSKISL